MGYTRRLLVFDPVLLESSTLLAVNLILLKLLVPFEEMTFGEKI